jgi:CO/xanthine dehydrogenase Mo-binding subunit/aerobic-type carbon monoxide dehydrogenase small subunit (CoxS/CutS family)
MTESTPTKLIDVQFQINGRKIADKVPESQMLLRYMRDELHLTGPKNGCSTGHCGACMIIMNGKPLRACLVKMGRVNGAVIETIEGLAENNKLHPLQQAFLMKNAVQCGFCTPGMIMSAKALLDTNPHPTLEEVKVHLGKNRNLCRCTGYIQIFEAIQLAARWLSHEEEQPPLYTGVEEISNSRNRSETIAILTGTYQYGDDIYPEGALYGKILWAAHPHAKILQVDPSAAEAMPGVVAVVTARDIPGKNQCGNVIRDQPAIAFDKVRYIGDSLAAVFAESLEIAEKAVKLIKVDYEVLPGVFSPEEAAKPDAPKVHEKGNLMHHAKIERGNVEEGFKQCKFIVEGDYETPFIEHGFLEPESGLAFPMKDGGVEIHIGTQTAFDDRTQLTEILALPEDKIRIIQNPIGGAFGGKEDMILQQYLALGALKCKRPVKMVMTREESLRVHVKRHPVKLHYKTGADENGKVLAIEATSVLDTGAYISLGLDVLENVVVFGAGPYYVPNLKLDGYSYYTNNVLAGAMRGFGVNQVAIALEQQFDELAEKLAIDPFEFRLINGLDVGLPSAPDHIMEKGVVAIKETIVAARDEFRKHVLPKPTPGKKIGFGVASAVKNIGFGHGIPESAGAIVELQSDGTVILSASQHEYGQGARVGLTKLVMNELGIPAEKIRYVGPDTALTPATGSTTASRQTFLSGNAVVKNARRLREEITSRAGDRLGIIPDQLIFQGEMIVDPESGEGIAIKELGNRFVFNERYDAPTSVQMHAVGKRSEFGSKEFKSRPLHFCYSYNTQVAIVEVDEQTGAVKVLKLISANDVGRILNYEAIIGQIHGGVVMGMGFALTEQFIVEKGVNLTDTLLKCGMTYANTVPEVIPVVVEVPHPFGPQGAKGFAEAPSLATAPAILNAIYNATGARVHQIPATPARVKAAMEQSKVRR